MGPFELLKSLFLKPRSTSPEDLSPEAALQINFRVVVVEFADNVEGNSGEFVTNLLKTCEGLSVSYFDEPFAKDFLSLESRTLFDLLDRGQNILDKTGADVLLWGCRENDKIRINLQTPQQYAQNGDSFVSLLDSLYLPAEYLSGRTPFPPALLTLLYGAVVCALNLEERPRQIQKRYLLKKIIARLTADNSAKSLSIDYLPFIMNFLGIIYLSYCARSTDDKDYKIVKNLLETAIKHQDLIKNPIHLGCIYNHFGQLYATAGKNLSRPPANAWRGAINNYRLAQKYLGKYNYAYDYGMIAFRLSDLYYDYWRQKEDLQALRDSVFNLREAEKIFTYPLFPEFWAQIEGRLGYLLSLLGNITASDDISELAVAAYKNQQKIITEKRDPFVWAQIQEKIGDIYFRSGKKSADRGALEEALEYFHDALYIFENMSLSEDIQRLTASIAKTGQILSYH